MILIGVALLAHMFAAAVPASPPTVLPAPASVPVSASKPAPASVSAPAAAPSAPAPNPATSSLAIVALDGPDVRAEVARLLELARERGVPLLEADDISRKLRGVPPDCNVSATATSSSTQCDVASAGSGPNACYCHADEAALSVMLRNAYEAEGYFQDQKADDLRQKIMEAFNREARPSARLLQIAGESLLGRASGSYAQGKNDDAAKWAREAMRHFSGTSIDTMRYSPPMQKLFAKAREAVEREPRVEVRVHSSEAGHIWADGNDLGPIQHDAVVRLPAGEYRLWLKAGDDTLSLPLAVKIKKDPIDLDFDPQLDRQLVLARPVRVKCAGRECEDLLVRLRQRLVVDTLVGVGYGPDSVLQALVIAATPARPRWLSVSALGGETFIPPTDLGPRQPGTTTAAASTTPSSAGAAVPPATFWTQHKWQVVSAVAGVVALGTGVILHMQAASQRDQSNKKGIAQVDHDSLNESADKKTLAAYVLYGVGGAGIGTAGVMFLMDF